MRKSVGALITVVMLMLAFSPAVVAATDDNHHKYGIELMIGGGSTAMEDVNNYIPSNSFDGLTPSNKLDVGMSFGLGLLYRQGLYTSENTPHWFPKPHYFGWQFGYNRFVSLSDDKFRIANGGFPESWAEQTISGSEISAQATWYWPLYKNIELSLGFGPALYSASMDRQLSVVNSSGSVGKEGSFSNATGRSGGFVGSVGFELPLSSDVGITLTLGGRYAKISKLYYTNPNYKNDTLTPSEPKELPVWLDATSQRALPVDYSGVFLKFSLRGYFEPDSDWRSLQK